MNLKLQKPLIFFDLETTGLSITKDRIVQLSYIKVKPDGTEEEGNLYINPECHIPEETTAVHHIDDAMVADKPTFSQLAGHLKQVFVGCDLAGYNSNRFDVPMLFEEFARAGIKFDLRTVRLIDVQSIFYKKEPRTLVAAYKFYCGKELDGAHSADCDTRATYEVLLGQLQRYPDLMQDGEGKPVNDPIKHLSEYTRMNRNVDLVGAIVLDDKERPCFAFGKYKGMPVTDVLRKDATYYSWMMNGDFAKSTKDVLTQLKLSMMKQ